MGPAPERTEEKAERASAVTCQAAGPMPGLVQR